jgi:hypothetical protein
MKMIFTIAALFMGVATSQVLAQGDLEKMKVFEPWVGTWKGEGAMQMGPGEPKKSSVTENIVFKLGGMVLQVEGTGTVMNASTNQEMIVHQALGIISFDKASGQYKFKTYLKDGKSADAWLNVKGDNTYEWGFDVPNRKIRYTIVIDPSKKTWREVGETSADGMSWMKFFEMNLTKTE